MAPVINVVKRHYFECENGARWSEPEWDQADMNQLSQDGAWCFVSGCKEYDHRIKLVKSNNVKWDEYRVDWFRKPKTNYNVDRFQKIIDDAAKKEENKRVKPENM